MRCEREIFFREGRILEKTLRQIDCRYPQMTQPGGMDCNWACEETILRHNRRAP